MRNSSSGQLFRLLQENRSNQVLREMKDHSAASIFEQENFIDGS
jgi:hypothetical protein